MLGCHTAPAVSNANRSSQNHCVTPLSLTTECLLTKAMQPLTISTTPPFKNLLASRGKQGPYTTNNNSMICSKKSILLQPSRISRTAFKPVISHKRTVSTRAGMLQNMLGSLGAKKVRSTWLPHATPTHRTFLRASKPAIKEGQSWQLCNTGQPTPCSWHQRVLPLRRLNQSVGCSSLW